MHRFACSTKISLLALAGALALAGPASALSVTLDTEFDNGTLGNHASLTITENAGALDFSLTLAGTDLGAGSDLHEFYFNLLGDPTHVVISDTNAPNTAYALTLDPSVAGGAGSSFEYGVNFGNGAGAPGNGVLTTATFRISADQPLTLASLSPTSETSAGIVVNFAAHVQGTSGLGETSETVGGVIPEPSTALLLTTGLIGLARAGRRLR